MAQWPKNITTPTHVMLQDPASPSDRYEIGTARYRIGKATRSKTSRVNATVKAGDKGTRMKKGF